MSKWCNSLTSKGVYSAKQPNVELMQGSCKLVGKNRVWYRGYWINRQMFAKKEFQASLLFLSDSSSTAYWKTNDAKRTKYYVSISVVGEHHLWQCCAVQTFCKRNKRERVNMSLIYLWSLHHQCLSPSHFTSCRAVLVLTDVAAFCCCIPVTLRQMWRNPSAQIPPILLDNRGVGAALHNALCLLCTWMSAHNPTMDKYILADRK